MLDAYIIDVETDTARGLFAFSVVGLPDKAVEESRDRVSAAIKNSGFESPKSSNKKIVVSLAPAHVKKEGSAFDVAIALGYLLAEEVITFDTVGKLFLGELSLDGMLRPIRGALSLVAKAKELGFTEVYLPKENANEAAIVEGIAVYPAETFIEIVNHLSDKKRIWKHLHVKDNPVDTQQGADIGDIAGNEHAKRALSIAAAGGHNILLYGPPGTGKTMLARALAGILPPFSFNEMLEVTGIHSIAGTLSGTSTINTPQIRSPHHTSSYVALVGGGATPRPGEATLAHRGVLFLDEFPEFDRKVIEALREPLEEGFVTVARAKGTAKFPARFMLVAAMNPCPCGNFGIVGKKCTCSPLSIERYKKKLSGPILDRIDMFIEVSKVSHGAVIDHKRKEGERNNVRSEVAEARNRALDRNGKQNRDIGAREISVKTHLSNEAKKILELSAQKLDLSARACHRIMRLGRTIADMENAELVSEKHILEALQYRPKHDLLSI